MPSKASLPMKRPATTTVGTHSRKVPTRARTRHASSDQTQSTTSTPIVQLRAGRQKYRRPSIGTEEVEKRVAVEADDSGSDDIQPVQESRNEDMPASLPNKPLSSNRTPDRTTTPSKAHSAKRTSPRNDGGHPSGAERPGEMTVVHAAVPRIPTPPTTPPTSTPVVPLSQNNGARLSQHLTRTTARMDGLDRDMSFMRKDVSEMKAEVAEVKNSMTVVAQLLDVMNGKMTALMDNGGGNSSASRATGSNNENSVKPMVKYEQIMTRRVPNREIAFDSNVLPPCTVSSLFAEIADRCAAKVLDPTGLLHFLEAMFFSLKRTDRKDLYKSKTGKEASALRHRILQNLLKQGRLDTFRRFRTSSTCEQDVKSQRSGVTAAADAGRLPKPHWLSHSAQGGTNYITQEHLRLAQELQESSSADKSSYTRRLQIACGEPPIRKDDAEFAMSYLYTRLLTTLNRSRRNGPLEFFQQVGYLFMDWSLYKNCRVSSDDLKVSWVVDFEKARPCDLSDIPRAIIVSAGDENALEKNAKMYEKFVEDREEMQILVQHDVLVRLKGRKEDFRNHIGVETRQWTRIVSLIDVAAHFLRSSCSFGRSGRFYDILTYNSTSIVALYNIAWVFRKVLASRRNPSVMPPSSSSASVHVTSEDGNDANDESSELDSVFALLTPSESMVSRALVRVTCAVPEETYHATHISPPDSSHGVEERGGRMGDDDRSDGEADGSSDSDGDDFDFGDM